MKSVFAAIPLVAMLAGCATAPPNTPGAGSGKAYTPVIDMQGINSERYMTDLGDCRAYSGTINVQDASVSGAIGGVIVMAALSAMLGGNQQMNTQAATAGGFAGLSSQGGKAIGKQERIIMNCMASRGYRVLDGAAPVQVIYAQQQPGTAQAASPYSYPAQNTPANKPETLGKAAYQAEKFAKEQACTPTPALAMAAKGPGFETYSAACTSGDTLMIKCEFGNCRALR
jgi:hypothetical protein